MPPRAKGHSLPSAALGPHGGQASIRKAYETHGVQHFYASHGAHYTNPHEVQIFSAIAQLMAALPADVWLGFREVNPDAMTEAKDEDDSDGEGSYDDGGETNTLPACQRPHRGRVSKDDAHKDDDSRDTSVGLCNPSVNVASHDLPHFRNGNRAGVGVSEGMAGALTVSLRHDKTEGTEDCSSAAVSVLRPPVMLRVLDLACGSGEATMAIMDWNQRHPLTASSAAVTAPSVIGAVPSTSPLPAGSASSSGMGTHPTAKSTGKAGRQQQSRRRSEADAAVLLLPYELHITACDPYTGAAYLQRTGRTALIWSFEDIANGCLADWEPAGAPLSPSAGIASPSSLLPLAGAGPHPHFDLVICSFALHLCDPSRLYGTCTALSLAARWLVVLAPHKRPVLGPDLGWQLVMAWKVERTHLRLYRSLRIPAAGDYGDE